MNNRNRDRRPDGNKKFGNKPDWNSQGGSGGGQWGGNNWNNYGNNSGMLLNILSDELFPISRIFQAGTTVNGTSLSNTAAPTRRAVRVMQINNGWLTTRYDIDYEQRLTNLRLSLTATAAGRPTELVHGSKLRRSIFIEFLVR